MEYIEIIKSFIENYPILLSIAGGMLQGEEFMVLLAALSRQQLLPLWIAIVFFTVGSISMDVFLFFISRIGVLEYIFGEKRVARIYSKVDFLLKRISGNHIFLPLFIAKSLYGTGIAMIIYLGKSEIKLFGFLKYLFYSTLALVFITTTLGLLAGEAVSILIGTLEDVKLVITIVVVIVIVLYILEKDIKLLIRNRLTNNKH